MDNQTYLTTEELANRLRYDPRYVRNNLKDTVLLEGVHYFRPFGRRKILFIWEAVERDMKKLAVESSVSIPMSGGRVCHG